MLEVLEAPHAAMRTASTKANIQAVDEFAGMLHFCVDLESRTWTVPASRMKAKRDHRVPLSARALQIRHEARDLSEDSDLVFPTAHGRALSDNTISKLLRELGARGHAARLPLVVPGLGGGVLRRAPRGLRVRPGACESDRVEAAYRRTDLFERRRVLMEEWSGFVGRAYEGDEN